MVSRKEVQKEQRRKGVFFAPLPLCVKQTMRPASSSISGIKKARSFLPGSLTAHAVLNLDRWFHAKKYKRSKDAKEFSLRLCSFAPLRETNHATRKLFNIRN